MTALRVTSMWRHPVKSMQGEELDVAHVNDTGLDGDRAWAVIDTATGIALTGRREPRLLLAGAKLGPDGDPEVTLPDGTSCAGTGRDTDAALSGWLGRDVTLAAADRLPSTRAEAFADATDDSSPVMSWAMPAGRFVDLFPLLIITTASLRAGARSHPNGRWEIRRFRPNLVIEAPGDDWYEDAWVGTEVSVGTVRLAATRRASRCTMVTRPQPGIERDLDIYRTLAAVHHADFGVWAIVATPGTVRIGDGVSVD
ncbi:MAG TPA: MOSC N-terminal beta barrel domain-containing protein [Acidimicrobiales bacterium]|nr:MOSC N-terminal beta barrel domain-containing protein [Acidimicrobiales bacterium]